MKEPVGTVVLRVKPGQAFFSWLRTTSLNMHTYACFTDTEAAGQFASSCGGRKLRAASQLPQPTAFLGLS